MEAGGAVIIAVLKDVRVGERFCSPCAGGCGGRAGSGVSAGPSSRSLCWRPSRRWRPGWRREKLRQSRARAPPRPAGVTARQRPVLVQSCWSRSRGSGPRGRVPLTCERCPLPGAPGGSDCEEPACSAGGPGFHPWVGKIPWRRAWQPTPVSLPRESHGQRSLEGYGPRGRKESDTTERLTQQPAKQLD